jgi:hypothetical protein
MCKIILSPEKSPEYQAQIQNGFSRETMEQARRSKQKVVFS